MNKNKQKNSMFRYIEQSRKICEEYNGLSFCKNCQIDFDVLESKIKRLLKEAIDKAWNKKGLNIESIQELYKKYGIEQ